MKTVKQSERSSVQTQEWIAHKKGFYERNLKRILDTLLAGAALIILLPLIAVIAVLVKIKLGSPIIF